MGALFVLPVEQKMHKYMYKKKIGRSVHHSRENVFNIYLLPLYITTTKWLELGSVKWYIYDWLDEIIVVSGSQ